jgi:gluconokinase
VSIAHRTVEVPPATFTVVVMGVSGAGKSSVGARLAEQLKRPFCDADRFHPRSNVDKMRCGTALTDADRAPWLGALAEWIAGAPPAVLACSALRRRYRDRLREAEVALFFAHLDPPMGVLERRLGARQGHFMPASLLPEQLAAFEPLTADESGVRIEDDRDCEGIVKEIIAALPG